MEHELKDALKVLGLEVDATQEEVERKYELLLKRARFAHDHKKTDKSVSLEEINKAYNVYIEYYRQKERDQFNKEQYAKYKRFGKVAEKVDHFYHYYRIHVLVVVVVLLVAIFGTKGYLDAKAEREALAKLPLNLEFSVFGDFRGTESKEIAEKFVEVVPEWERVTVELAYVPSEIRSEMDVALQQKSVLSLITDRPDVFLADYVSFERLAKQGALIPLDPWMDQLQPLTDENSFMYEKDMTEEIPESKFYGIDVTDHPIFEEMNLISDGKVLAMRIETKREQSVITFFENFLALQQTN